MTMWPRMFCACHRCWTAYISYQALHCWLAAPNNETWVTGHIGALLNLKGFLKLELFHTNQYCALHSHLNNTLPTEMRRADTPM